MYRSPVTSYSRTLTITAAWLAMAICLNAGKCGKDTFEAFKDVAESVIENYQRTSRALEKAADGEDAASILDKHVKTLAKSNQKLQKIMGKAPELKPENRLKAPVEIVSLYTEMAKERKKFLLTLALNSPRFIMNTNFRSVASRARDSARDLMPDLPDLK